VRHRVTLDDLAEARRFTAKLRDAEPDLLAPGRVALRNPLDRVILAQ
jgi:hypothetical protein